MHPTPTFHWDDEGAMLAFVGERAFATIAATLDGALVFAQAPVVVDGRRLLLHLSRANRLAKALPQRVSVIVSGPDTYVSPDWYGELDQVPTWSYVSVELDGQLVATDEAMLLDILRRQSATFEGRLAGKRPWTPDKMTPSVLAAKLKGIVGATLSIDALRGTRKLSQNKSESARAGVVQVLADSPREADRTIAALMRS
ncbi:MAG TPA: FMN-binding negative transcriptional regulator [Kofleriaceae bacterium]